MTHSFRPNFSQLACVSVMSLAAAVALAGPNGKGPKPKSYPLIEATFNPECTQVQVESEKALSNIVILYDDQTWEKFEFDDADDQEDAAEQYTEQYETTDGTTMVKVFVKSGPGKRKVDGLPGYVGVEFSCDATTPPSA